MMNRRERTLMAVKSLHSGDEDEFGAPQAWFMRLPKAVSNTRLVSLLVWRERMGRTGAILRDL